MRGMGHGDPIETANVTHEEGNEGEKIGVERGIGAFYGGKLLKRQGGEGARFSVCVRTRFRAIQWNEAQENPAQEGRTNLAQRRGPQHARFWRDGVEGFSAGKSGRSNSRPGTTEFSRTRL
jgi:hypothetical protein